ALSANSGDISGTLRGAFTGLLCAPPERCLRRRGPPAKAAVPYNSNLCRHWLEAAHGADSRTHEPGRRSARLGRHHRDFRRPPSGPPGAVSVPERPCRPGRAAGHAADVRAHAPGIPGATGPPGEADLLAGALANPLR